MGHQRLSSGTGSHAPVQWLARRALGAKSLYLWCFPIFTLSSALCGLAWSANSLIGFRVLQGMSGGLMAPLAQMMMARAAGRHMARVLSYAAIPILLGPLLGPVLAGAILQHASWRWLFLVNVPVGLLGIVLAIRFLPEDRAEARSRDLDLPRLLPCSPQGSCSFSTVSDHLSERIGLTAFFVALVLLTVFFRTATMKGEDALIDLQLFRGKDFSASVPRNSRRTESRSQDRCSSRSISSVCAANHPARQAG